ncbi:MAG: DcaP family trimeric outer membrane transporter [Pseudomonadota bacterium]
MRHVAICLLLLFSSSARCADSADQELRDKVRSLEARVQYLESRLEALLAAGDSTAVPSSAPDPAIDTAPVPSRRMGMGGRVKVDAIANSVSAGGPGGTNRADTALTPRSIPLDGAGEDGQLSASARDSRFWIDAVSPTDFGDLSAYLEVDFVSFDGSGNERISNSYNLRLRHAYGTFRQFTVGQTYTTFLNSLAYPELNDANGPVGILNIRQPLLRYSRSVGGVRASFAVEQPETVLDVAGTRQALDDDRWPDMVARADVDGDWGNWSVAAILRNLRIDEPGSGAVDAAWGGGLSASGRIYLSEQNNLRFAATVGHGIGRYVSFNAFDDGALTAGGDIRPTPVGAAFLGYQHWYGSRLRSTLVAGIARADLDPALFAGQGTKSIASVHMNLLWSPIPEATVGLEWIHARRSLLDGRSGSLNRIQLTSLYKFKQQ